MQLTETKRARTQSTPPGVQCDKGQVNPFTGAGPICPSAAGGRDRPVPREAPWGPGGKSADRTVHLPALSLFLVCVSVLLPGPHCFVRCSFVVSFKSQSVSPLALFSPQDCFGFLGPFALLPS